MSAARRARGRATDFQQHTGETFAMLIALIISALVGSCTTKSDNPITQAAQLDDEYAIAICVTPKEKPVNDVIRAETVIGGAGPFGLKLRSTGVEYCDIVRIVGSGGHSAVRIVDAKLDEIHVHRFPPNVGVEDPKTRRVEFTTIRRGADDAFRFLVVVTDEVVPVLTVGRVRSSYPLLVPTNGPY